jgi:hypothetical protein
VGESGGRGAVDRRCMGGGGIAWNGGCSDVLAFLLCAAQSRLRSGFAVHQGRYMMRNAGYWTTSRCADPLSCTYVWKLIPKYLRRAGRGVDRGKYSAFPPHPASSDGETRLILESRRLLDMVLKCSTHPVVRLYALISRCTTDCSLSWRSLAHSDR